MRADPAVTKDPYLEVARFASAQYGLIARAQALALGLSESAIKNAVSTGRWNRLHRGVYRIAGAPTHWEASVLAAVLAAGDGACASHRTAGSLLKLEGIGAKVVEISVPRKIRPFASDVTIHRIRNFPESDTTLLGCIPVTEPTRTLLDLASVLTPDALELALEDALRRRLTTLARLRWRLAGSRSKGKPGAAALRGLVDDRSPATPVTGSGREVRLLQLLRKANLPPPTRQYEIRDNGQHIARVDLAYPERKLAIEFDSYRWHSGREALERDRSRSNALQRLNWRVLHVTSRQLESPKELIETIRSYLGW